ncbi:MAG TPA: NUDIX hydrolase [Chloroflexota bacterium]|jgi:ADP-ribose pyrophosphatase|nr:NUDIX hydrolase [Chloroflexota bacterium]
MPNQTVVSSQHVYRGRVVDLRVDEIRLPTGAVRKREVVEHRGAVCIVALDDRGRVLLVRQHRAPAGRELVELPAGTLERGEEPEPCARRELAEETGYRPGRLERLLGFYSAPGFCTEYLHLFLATELEEERRDADEDEEIAVERVPIEEAVAAAARGEYEDAKTLVGLLAYAARGFSLRP